MMTDTLAALNEAATPAPWDLYSDGEDVVIQQTDGEGDVVMCYANGVLKMPHDQDVLLIVRLRNDYANGDLITRAQ